MTDSLVIQRCRIAEHKIRAWLAGLIIIDLSRGLDCRTQRNIIVVILVISAPKLISNFELDDQYSAFNYTLYGRQLFVHILQNGINSSHK